MPKTQTPWNRYALIAAALTTAGGGVPYITTLQTKVDETRERLIRMEEQIKAESRRSESMEKTLEEIRKRLEAKGIVNHIGFRDVGTIAGEKHTEK